jgi:predicted ATPase/class 3 adenylate cyclase
MSELPSGTVTFVFTDLATSTRLWDEQPEAMRAALARHDELLASAVHARGGHVLKHTGDGVLAVFPRPDAAVLAAVDGQRALSAEDWGSIGSLRARMGLHTGVAEERDGDYFGPVLNRAARLMAMAHAGQVLCSQATTELVRDSASAEIGFIELGGYQLRDLQRPEVVFQVTHRDLATDFPRLRAASGGGGNLPRRLTSFIGHEHDLLVIPEEMALAPVVTLTGVGGVGKTRLALEVAAGVEQRFRDGAWLCALDGVRQGEAVADAVLDVFGIESQGGSGAAAVTRFLQSKQLVLVLDNCEHLLRPVARLINEIVTACPEVKVLATSREGLGIPGERIFAVAALDVPETAEDTAAISRAGAVRLFAARAQAVRGDFVVDAGNAASVAQICARLDGVPLAIELAAARVGLLTAPELALRLQRHFRVLTGSERGAVERHQTLRAAIDWSYDLLDQGERRLLDCFSVFAGGFTLDAAEAVGGEGLIDEVDVLELLASLVAKSLVVADARGMHTRYRLLETIRQYAAERLEESGKATATRDAHARYFAEFSKDAAAGLHSADEPEWIVRVVPESDNMRVALTWAIETNRTDTAVAFYSPGSTHDFSELGRLVVTAAPSAVGLPGIAENRRYPIVLGCAAMYAASRGEHEAMRAYVVDALAAQAQLNEVFPDVIGARIFAALAEGRVDDYQAYQRQAITLYRDTDNQERLAISLAGSAMATALRGDDIALAVAEIDEAVALAERLAIPSSRVGVAGFAAFVLAEEQPERARALMDDAAALRALIPGMRSPIHSVLGDVAERLGDHRLALEYFVLGMDEHHWLGGTELTGRMLRRIGLLLVEHDPEQAAIIIGAGMARSQASSLTERVNRHHEERIAVLDRSIGTARRETLMHNGAALDNNEAVLVAHAAAERALTDFYRR